MPPSSEEDDDEFRPDVKAILSLMLEYPNVPPWVKLAAEELIRDTRRKKSEYQNATDQPFVLRGSRRLPLETLRAIVEGQKLDKDDVEILSETDSDGPTDDDASSFRDFCDVTLGAHCKGVAELARRFAAAIGLPEHFVADLELAGYFHDVGKIDPRFQAMLFGGDEIECRGRT